MQIFIALLAGLLMSAGMAVSHMIDPNKVLGFLTLNSSWDPSLALVMGAALAVYASGYWWFTKRKAFATNADLQLPVTQSVDKPLVIGAALFGAGWGLVGYCPGPAIAALPSASIGTFSFVLAMLVGWFISYRVRLP